MFHCDIFFRKAGLDQNHPLRMLTADEAGAVALISRIFLVESQDNVNNNKTIIACLESL